MPAAPRAVEPAAATATPPPSSCCHAGAAAAPVRAAPPSPAPSHADAPAPASVPVPAGTSCCAAPTAGAPARAAASPGPAAWPWRTAALNTSICLLGCSLGDVAVVVATRTWWPSGPMAVVLVLAVVAGLATSLALESTWLVLRGSAVRAAVVQAARMSLLSMVAMELAMNVVDLGLTGGMRMGLPWPAYLRILAGGEVAGFLVPLPYNAWRLARGHACH